MKSENSFTLRRDENGFACAIDCRDVTVLHLQVGTERNEVCAELMVEAMNGMDVQRIEKILQAVGAYRFLGKLLKRKGEATNV